MLFNNIYFIVKKSFEKKENIIECKKIIIIYWNKVLSLECIFIEKDVNKF